MVEAHLTPEAVDAIADKLLDTPLTKPEARDVAQRAGLTLRHLARRLRGSVEPPATAEDVVRYLKRRAEACRRNRRVILRNPGLHDDPTLAAEIQAQSVRILIEMARDVRREFAPPDEPPEPALTADMTRVLPGGVLDDSAYQAIEDICDAAEIDCRDRGGWLTLTERVKRLADRGAEVGRLREAVDGIADDYMTSEHHHPGYVLIPSSKFEALRTVALARPAAPAGETPA